MPTLALRLMRYLGWGVILASVGVVCFALLIEIVRGPLHDQSPWPTPARWRYLGNTLAMSAAATVLAVVIALLPALSLSAASSRRGRAFLAGSIAIPLLTMPSIFAYAWILLSTIPASGHHALALVGRLLGAIGWNRPGAQIWEAAWVLATWLWPIPALILATSFRRQGLAAYQMAVLDAPPLRAFRRAVLPVMRAPLLAAIGAVFVLASIDATIPPLMQATDTWAVELLAQAAIASSRTRPFGFLFWQCWPLLLLVAGGSILALPGLRAMARWADAPAEAETGSAVASGIVLRLAGICVALFAGLFPIAVFAAELANGRSTFVQSLHTACATLANAGLASLIASAGAAVASACAVMAVLDDAAESRITRALKSIVVAATLACAILPPELVGTALASTYARICNPMQWNIYDNTPLVWMAALCARFLFIPMMIARMLNRRVPDDLISSARSEGASCAEIAAQVRVPAIWGGVFAGLIMVTSLGISEVAASMIVQPSQFIGGSLAFEIDNQMHYGRQNETIAAALLMLLPALLAGLVAGLWMKKR